MIVRTDSAAHPSLPRRMGKAPLIVALVVVAVGAYWLDGHRPHAAVHAVLSSAQARVTTVVVAEEHRLTHEIAAEYRAIRPADTDATPPPIPVSETWPAQR